MVYLRNLGKCHLKKCVPKISKKCALKILKKVSPKLEKVCPKPTAPPPFDLKTLDSPPLKKFVLSKSSPPLYSPPQNFR